MMKTSTLLRSTEAHLPINAERPKLQGSHERLKVPLLQMFMSVRNADRHWKMTEMTRRKSTVAFDVMSAHSHLFLLAGRISIRRPLEEPRLVQLQCLGPP